jgi:hypothetical protein
MSKYHTRFVNYGRKKFHDIGPRGARRSKRPASSTSS